MPRTTQELMTLPPFHRSRAGRSVLALFRRRIIPLPAIRTPVAAAMAALLFIAFTGAAHANTTRGEAGAKSRSIHETFRLHVSGRIAPGTTFWVAYGPLDDRFVILQLHRVRPDTYAASEDLPVGGRTSFAYLTGHGTIMTRLGLVPGNPVVTIRQVGPVTISDRALPAVQWQEPVG